MTQRVFCDSSVLLRYFADDDPPRALAAARLVDGSSELIVSTGVLLETIHAMRTDYGATNPGLAELLIQFLTRDNVSLADADLGATVAALRRTLDASARRVPDAILAAAAERARCDWIATFDDKFASPTVPSRLL